RNDWRDGGRFAESWRKPGRGNRTYITSKETTLELVKAFDQGLENLRDRRIAPAIGLGPTRRQMRPVLWRSKLSIVLFKANMVAAQKLLTSGGLAQAYVLARDNSEEARGDMSSLTSEFRITIAAVDKLARMSDAFARPDTRGRLVALGAPLKNIKVRTVGLLKDAAGLSIGFNASDGD
ncbi:MAG: hypothetical protein KDJ36_05015, partial [Hyphomicrobiaceae bacterium]|nr:hypothetical protein [Hyphomicrobiaceae bacterium]